MHPGELLRNEIKERELKQTELERLFDKIETTNKTENKPSKFEYFNSKTGKYFGGYDGVNFRFSFLCIHRRPFQ